MKCQNCKKKLLKIMESVSRCACKNNYCGKHRHDHNCTFDYKSRDIVRLQRQLVKAQPKKVNFI
jgi:hypothetical protein